MLGLCDLHRCGLHYYCAQDSVGQVGQMERYLCRRRTNLVAEWNSCLMPRDTDSRLLGLWGLELSAEQRRMSQDENHFLSAKAHSLSTHVISEWVREGETVPSAMNRLRAVHAADMKCHRKIMEDNFALIYSFLYSCKIE